MDSTCLFFGLFLFPSTFFFFFPNIFIAPEIVNYEPLGLAADMW